MCWYDTIFTFNFSSLYFSKTLVKTCKGQSGQKDYSFSNIRNSFYNIRNELFNIRKEIKIKY